MADEEEVSLGLILDIVTKNEEAINRVNESLGRLSRQEEQTTSGLHKLSEQMNTLIERTGSVTGQLGGMISEFAVAGIGIATVTGAFVELGHAGVEWADQMTRMTAITGLSSHNVELYSTALADAGLNTAALQRTSFMLERQITSIVDAQNKGEQVNNRVTESLRKLGVSYRDADGSARNMNDLLPELLERIGNLATNEEKAQIAGQLFGRMGSQLLPFLDNYKALMEKANEQVHRFGIEGVNAQAISIAYHTEMQTLSMVFEKLAVEVVPVFIDVIAGVRTAFESVAGPLERVIAFSREHHTTTEVVAVSVSGLTAAYYAYEAVIEAITNKEEILKAARIALNASKSESIVSRIII